MIGFTNHLTSNGRSTNGAACMAWAVTPAYFLSWFSFRLLGQLIFCFLVLFVCPLFLTLVLILLAFVSHRSISFLCCPSSFQREGTASSVRSIMFHSLYP